MPKLLHINKKLRNNANDATENASEKDEKAPEIQADDVHQEEKIRDAARSSRFC